MLTAVLILSATTANAQSLEASLKEAAENNEGLKAKYAEFEAALQKVAQSNSLPDPTLSFGFFISPVETRVGPQRAKLSLMQMFPWFGTLAVKENIATLLAEAKYQVFLNARNELFYKVKAAWYPLYEINTKIELQQANREILLIYKDLATTGYKNGKNPMTDVIRVDILLSNVDLDIKLLEDKKRPLSAHFNLLLNRHDSATIQIPTGEPSLSNSMDRKDSLLASHPLLEAYDLKIEAIRSKQNLAKKQGLPKIGLGLNYIVVGERTDVDLPDNGKDVLMPSVNVSLPIFRKKYKAAEMEAQFLETAAIASKKDLENTLLSSYEMEWFKSEMASQQIELYQKQMVKTKQLMDLLVTTYSNSGQDFEETLRVQQELLNYQMAEATAKKDYQTALAKLDYLTAKPE